MSSVLVVALPSLALLSQIVGSDVVKDGKTCPAGQFAQTIPDNTITFFTDNTREYGKLWLRPSSSRLAVWIKACKDAHFMLQTSNVSIAYEIVLGASCNFRTDIRFETKILTQSITADLLRCDTFLPFAIAWNKSKIVVARGTNNSETVIELAIPSHDMDVKLIDMAGYELPHDIADRFLEEYQLNESEVSSFGVKTPAESAYKRFRRTLYGQDGVRFKLKGSGEATLAFIASEDKDFNKPTYKLTIGAKSNTQTIFLNSLNQSLLSNYTPELLSNGELREFWVAWKDGIFGFGLGSEFYKNFRLVFLNASAVEKIHSMAIDTTQEADWEFRPFPQQGYSCRTTCQLGWYPDEKTGNCRQCSTQLSNCFSCTHSHSSKWPVCTACVNGTVMLDEGGECLTDCPPRLGYTADYERGKCVCAFGSCCGPVLFRLCFIVLPCLLGLLLLVPVLLVAIRKVRRLKIIDLDNIDFDQLLPPHVANDNCDDRL